MHFVTVEAKLYVANDIRVEFVGKIQIVYTRFAC